MNKCNMKVLNTLIFLFCFTVYSQDNYFIQVPSLYDVESYRFVEKYISENILSGDSIVLVIDGLGLQELNGEDDLLFSFEFCDSIRHQLKSMNTERLFFSSVETGDYLRTLITKRSDSLQYVDSICKRITGKDLNNIFALGTLKQYKSLQDTIIKYCKMETWMIELFKLNVSGKSTDIEKMKILNSFSGENRKFVLISESWSGREMNANVVCLLAKLMIGVYPNKKRKNKINVELNEFEFRKIQVENLSRKNYFNSEISMKKWWFENIELFVYGISNPCQNYLAPNQIKRKTKSKYYRDK